PLLGFPVMAWVLHVFPVCGHEEHLEAHVYARLFASEGQRLSRHLRTRDGGVPPVRLLGDRDRLRGALNGAMQAERDVANLGEAEDTAVEDRATMLTQLRIGEAGI